MNVYWNKITSNNFSYSQENGWERQLPIEIEIHFKITSKLLFYSSLSTIPRNVNNINQT
jgi:hypothetical protein